ncbi:MAG TPA: trypsin-like peptidase domain-containing protein, partial [Candidatus Hydrogenedentes bacterium]|nr:trypsin-like peptidase domain-containing protein [Candidatus Hydrogenedentota bacterium]
PAWMSSAGEIEEQARAVMEQNQHAVVTVQLTTKTQVSFMGMGNEESEDKTEVTGTVIQPDGLTVIALSATDPMSMLQSLMGGMMDQMETNTRVIDVKMLRDDGSEIPSRVVLRDKDLDLAFVRPINKPADPLPCVDLTNAGTARVLDEVVALNRLGKVANRAYAAFLLRVHAAVSKPRTYYVPSYEAMTAQGSPVFTLDGKALGVVVLRTLKEGVSEAAGMAALFSGAKAGNMTPIILPASDILEVAAQAPESAEAAAEETSGAEETEAVP